ncbi:MAG: twin-arginine translocase subunit TatB [Candidatus Dadabacteria bacterium]|nr:MAG: twin-arginine translocase subunit TatB [Candidatus Dadabacteria bacterium]
MFGIGWAEFLFIAVIGLLVLGPEKLPEIARQMGKWMRELRRISAELRREFDDELYADDGDRSLLPGLGSGLDESDVAGDEPGVAPVEGDFGAVVRPETPAAAADSPTDTSPPDGGDR